MYLTRNVNNWVLKTPKSSCVEDIYPQICKGATFESRGKDQLILTGVAHQRFTIGWHYKEVTETKELGLGGESVSLSTCPDFH